MDKNSTPSPLKLKEETKEKFEDLLKQALNSQKPRNRSTQKLVLTTDVEQEPSKSTEIVQVDVHQDFSSTGGDNFILNKFLNDSYNTTDEIISIDVNEPEVVFIKPPVPKPRKKLSSASISSTDTYKIASSPNAKIKYEDEIKPKPRHSIFKEVAETVAKYKYEKIVAITLHKTDRLKLDSLVIHPAVKIHIVNSETGEYLKKSDKSRPVIFSSENMNVSYIMPVISEPYNLFENRSLHPTWEETVLINEDIHFILSNNNTIILFEIIDFVSFSVASSQFHRKGSSRGWHKIAWAFLKPIGKNGVSNLDKIARLQLYYPGKHVKVAAHVCDIFHWWRDKKLKYPASLFVTVTGVVPPEIIAETLRSKTPIKSKEVKLPKLKYHAFKLPNKCIVELDGHDDGCLAMKFSNNGLYLACAVLIDGASSIIIYSVKSYEEISRYCAHQGLIYEITWAKDDELILTSSADCTLCIWSFTNNIFVEMLPHPAYVYSGIISSKNVIATGCYDQTVRIWCRNENGYELAQELEAHSGYVTSLCFNKKSTLLYSSDSLGIIIEWKQSSETGWSLKRELNLADLRRTVINQILLHPRERRLLIHARDSALRIVDLNTGCIVRWLQGAVNLRFKTTASFSSCGDYIFAGGENGFVNVWNSDLGEPTATYAPYEAFNLHDLPVHCVEFHPCDNIFAVSHYGRNLPILLVMYDSRLAGRSNVGLKILRSSDEEQKRFESSSLDKVDESKSIVAESDVSDKQVRVTLKDVIQKIDQIIVHRASASDGQ